MAIETQDDILSSGEVTYTSRLGLPRVPRNNTRALAALNALSRLIDDKAVNRTGDTLTGNFVIIGNVSASGETSLTSALIDNAYISSGEIDYLVATEIAANSGEYTDLVTTNLTATNATVDSITARVINSDQIAKEEQTDILDLSTVRTANLSYDFSPYKVSYDLRASGEEGIIASGTVFRGGTSSYFVTSGEVDAWAGTGFARYIGDNYYRVVFASDTSVSVYIDRAITSGVPISMRIIAEK